MKGDWNELTVQEKKAGMYTLILIFLGDMLGGEEERGVVRVWWW